MAQPYRAREGERLPVNIPINRGMLKRRPVGSKSANSEPGADAKVAQPPTPSAEAKRRGTLRCRVDARSALRVLVPYQLIGGYQARYLLTVLRPWYQADKFRCKKAMMQESKNGGVRTFRVNRDFEFKRNVFSDS
ncbi:non-ribosomal peptide synthetase [Anopheles sinensis]|uniref:Non-ribosomal peptide synthetase n=1 Tax=Anopheles sinensis TaxID=74873 RepID=A0A084WJ09_ANOSI|nr:non-ribosomal peptide synthetase [Anopheles sinensis]